MTVYAVVSCRLKDGAAICNGGIETAGGDMMYILDE